MRQPRWVWSTMAGGVSMLAIVHLAAQGQRPTFVGGTQVVRLEVSVYDGSGTVTGLKPSDFYIRDADIAVNGFAVQELSDLPLDIVLIVQPLRSLWGQQPALFEGSVDALVRRLGSADRLGAIVAGTPPQRLRTLSDLGRSVEPGMWAGTPEPAVLDASGAGLMEFDGSERRKVLLVLSEGIDRFSVLHPDALAEAASRLKIQLVFLGSAPTLRVGTRYQYLQNGRLETAAVLANRFPSPGIRSLAAATGGHVVDLLDRDPDEVVRVLLNRLRCGYLLSYQGNRVPGWHPVTVSVKKRGVQVATRAGYFQ